MGLIFFYGLPVFSQTSPFLDSLLKHHLGAHQQLLTNPQRYKLQVIYTKIDRNEKNEPHFTDYKFHVHKDYVYPASTVKLPMALLALIKLEELNKPGLDRTSAMITDSAFYCQKKIKTDSTSSTGYPTLENYIKKMFLVSDNNAFARTYEFVGYDYAHTRLSELGFKNIRLFNRLDGLCPGDTAKITPPVYFLNENKDTVYKQGLTGFTPGLRHTSKHSRIGRYHTNAKGKLVKGPKDFANHNYLEAMDVHRLMKELVFNDTRRRLPLSSQSRQFMLRQLGLYPRESEYPHYDRAIFYDSFKKYLLYGSATAAIKQDSIRVINIVGRAYGFLIDCAYIIDLKNNLEFLLTASLYVNKSGRVGSGKYEYDQLGLPFMRDLGRSIYNYERKRARKHLPDLSEFKTLFDQK